MGRRRIGATHTHPTIVRHGQVTGPYLLPVRLATTWKVLEGADVAREYYVCRLTGRSVDCRLKSGISEGAADTLHTLDKVEKEQDLCTKSGYPRSTKAHH